MRVITVDNGNTNPHVGIFENGKLSAIIPLRNYISSPGDFIIASDVGAPLLLKLSYNLKAKRHTKNHPFFFEMPVNYAETLGDDRLITAHYVYKTLKNNEDRFLVIDAGTFITADVVTKKGFEGGFIFPGEKTFLSSYGKGAHLPILEKGEASESELPHTTEDAIWGAKDLYLCSILKGIVARTRPSKIFITGGAGELIEKTLREFNLKVQLERDPHLIHSALFLIQQSLPHQV
jgi:type III pantothenate kinase